MPIAWHDACHSIDHNTGTTKSQRENAKTANKAHHNAIVAKMANITQIIAKVPETWRKRQKRPAEWQIVRGIGGIVQIIENITANVEMRRVASLSLASTSN